MTLTLNQAVYTLIIPQLTPEDLRGEVVALEEYFHKNKLPPINPQMVFKKEADRWTYQSDYGNLTYTAEFTPYGYAVYVNRHIIKDLICANAEEADQYCRDLIIWNTYQREAGKVV